MKSLYFESEEKKKKEKKNLPHRPLSHTHTHLRSTWNLPLSCSVKKCKEETIHAQGNGKKEKGGPSLHVSVRVRDKRGLCLPGAGEVDWFRV